MSALLEYECQVPVDGYEVITVEEPAVDETLHKRIREMAIQGEMPWQVEAMAAMAAQREKHRPRKLRILQPRSERTRRFDLFENSPSAFLEFAQTLPNEDEIKDLAERYGPMSPDVKYEHLDTSISGRHITSFKLCIQEIYERVELWKMSKRTGDFSKIIRSVQRPRRDWRIKLLLKEDPSSASAKLCIRPATLADALWAQLLLAIDGNENLRACVQCRKWFTLEAGRGRSDKEYCSDACRMRAYRKRKG